MSASDLLMLPFLKIPNFFGENESWKAQNDFFSKNDCTIPGVNKNSVIHQT